MTRGLMTPPASEDSTVRDYQQHDAVPLPTPLASEDGTVGDYQRHEAVPLPTPPASVVGTVRDCPQHYAVSLRILPASPVGTVGDCQQHHAVPPPTAPVELLDVRALLQAFLSESSPSGGGADSSVGMLVEAFLDLPGNVCDAAKKAVKKLSVKFIAVIGLTGAGKSSIIRTLTGKDVHVEHSIAAGTTSFCMYPAVLGGQNYVLVDTPGFDDGHRSDTEVLGEILRWFETMSGYCTLAGILYVYDITPPRLSASAIRNLDMLQALCGPDFYPNVTIVTTKWGNMVEHAQRAAEGRQGQLGREAWFQLITGGARVFAYRNGVAEPYPDGGGGDGGGDGGNDDEEKRKQARADLEEMMAFYKTSRKIKPEIQKELRQGIRLPDTKAGRALLLPPQEQPPQEQPPQQQQPQQQQPQQQQVQQQPSQQQQPPQRQQVQQQPPQQELPQQQPQQQPLQQQQPPQQQLSRSHNHDHNHNYHCSQPVVVTGTTRSVYRNNSERWGWFRNYLRAVWKFIWRR